MTLNFDSIVPTPDGLEVLNQEIFVWPITNWTTFKKQERVNSPAFTCGTLTINYRRVLMFPNGNRTPDTISVFLECMDASAKPDHERWHCCVTFAIAAANFENERAHAKVNAANHRYTPKDTDWGFSQLTTHPLLSKNIEGFDVPIMENDQFKIIVYLKEIKDTTGVLWHNFNDWDSKLETGFVGLKNQGATCYLNSLLQSLYYTNYFRKATFAIPTDDADPTNNVPYALQRLFYHLQFSNNAVGTNELTKAFGWDSMDAFHQHDVQELNRVLQDNLENKMKGTPAEGAIRKLFTGKMKSYIQCIDVDFESSRVEEYYDIQLNVKGNKNLEESFADYCQVETLDGDNKYFAEGFGLQPAKKGVIFKSFPPVLHLQLKRFDYDMERDQFVKINDRHEFGMTLDLERFLDSDADKSIKQRYRLQGVLVHSGDLNAGHYFALIRPKKDGSWYRYDDDKVIPVTEKEVLNDNFGGEGQPVQNARANKIGNRYYTNAYMLVYIRESDEDEILAEVTEDDIPTHLKERVKRDIEEMERRQREIQEQHLYANVHVISDYELQNHTGFDIGFRSDHGVTVGNHFKFRKEATIMDLQNHIAENYNIDSAQVRLWSVITRQNKTCRAEVPLSSPEWWQKYVGDYYQNVVKTGEIKIYAQLAHTPISANQYFHPIGEKTANSQIMIFVKYYDPITTKMEVVGTEMVRSSSKIQDLIPKLLKLKGLPATQELILYEEVKPGMIDELDLSSTFTNAELVDGDIICFQRVLSVEDLDRMEDPVSMSTVPKYFEFLTNQISVTFISRERTAEGDGEFALKLSKKTPFDEVAKQVGSYLKHDPTMIKFYQSTHNRAPLQPVRRQIGTTLTEMVGQYYTNADPVLYYDLLDMSLDEFDSKRYIKVTFLDNTFKEHPIQLLVSRNGDMSEVIGGLKEKLNLDVDDSMIRLYEAVSYKKNKTHKGTDPIATYNEYATLYAEIIPQEELDVDIKGGMIVDVFHFQKETFRSHGIPFTFLLIPGEPLSEAKVRLQERSGISKKDFERVKLFHVTSNYTKITPLEEDDLVIFEVCESGGCLGLEHIDRGRKSSGGGIKIN
ncbi:hypothetical protein HDV06_004507 [Boothiomyces sp. JEL0866]|nr:hypothetical protein HDV06_004507 [Boothiomyces sp. JEL0866]